MKLLIKIIKVLIIVLILLIIAVTFICGYSSSMEFLFSLIMLSVTSLKTSVLFIIAIDKIYYFI